MDMEALRESADRVCEQLADMRPVCAAVLGSGWSSVVSDMPIISTIEYSDIPCLGAAGVKGHAGRLLAAESRSGVVLIFQGRRHWYEGVGWTPIAFPAYLSKVMGIDNMLLTNAAGGMREHLIPGDLMLITDHVNAMGANPLVGTHDPFWGDMFPDQTEVYDPSLRQLMLDSAASVDLKCKEGVYVAVSGPTYETPAEVRAFSSCGDAIGMSTVPEAILANAAGMRVVAVSCITNMASGVSGSPLSHEEVIAQTQVSEKYMRSLLASFLNSITPGG